MYTTQLRQHTIFLILFCINTMMFNGLLMCADSDCSDYFKDSSGAPSVAGSVSGAERARCLQDKLHATLQILKNKEETVRVQAESLSLAEARISALSSRVATPCDKMHREVQIQPLQKNSGSGCEVQMTDVSISAHSQDVDMKMVHSLKDNLSIVEDLYRECFYESAKQDQLIESLRKSYLEVRSMEREKVDQLGRLQHIVDCQRYSLNTYQDMALEVDNLKADISNFLNNSNYDSGMWERSEECDITEDLQHIAAQLQRLRNLLTAECTCGLDEEHKRLKRVNEVNESLIRELRQRVDELEDVLENKENADQRYQKQIAEKEHELDVIRQKLNSLEKSPDEECCCNEMSLKLQRAEELLSEKTSDFVQVQQKCEQQEETIRELKGELDKADVLMKEKSSVREEVNKLTAQVSGWRSQLEDSRQRLQELEHELHRSRQRCRHLAAHYKEKTNFIYELQAQLEEAQTRGATLCDEARHVVCAVRRCLRRQRERQRQQLDNIKRQENLIRTLQNSQTESDRLTEPCCSKYVSSASERGSCKMERNRSASETATSPPTPPRRLLRKKSSGDMRSERRSTRSFGVQEPVRSSCGTSTRGSESCTRVCSLRNNRGISPTDELLERVDRAHDALADAHKRWCERGRARDARRD